MLWLIRKLFQLIIASSIILIIVVVGLVLFLNPNNYKDEFNEQFLSYTGYPLEVTGAIEWSFNPPLSFHFQNITLTGPAGFKTPFLQIKDMHVNIDPLSLFGDNLIITDLSINGLTSTIEQPADGQDNFSLLFAAKKPANSAINIQTINMKDSSIIFNNEKTLRHWALNNADISIRNVKFDSSSPLSPIAIKGNLSNIDHNITMRVDTTITVDIAKQSISLDPITLIGGAAKVTGKTLITQINTNPIINGDMALESFDIVTVVDKIVSDPATVTTPTTDPTIDPTTVTATTTEAPIPAQKISGQAIYSYSWNESIFELSNFNIQLNDGVAKGDAKFSLVAPRRADFNVTIDKVDLQTLFNFVNRIFPATTEIDTFAIIDTLKTQTLKGKIAGTNVSLGPDFLIDHLTAEISAENGIMQLAPMTLSAYQGNHNFSLLVDVSKEFPNIKMVEQANNVDLAPWLKLLNYPSIVTGVVEAKVSLEATGNNLTTLAQSTTGGANFVIKKGTLLGFDLDKLLQYSTASINDVFNQLNTSKTANLDSLAKLKANDWISSQQSSPSTMFEILDIKNDIKAGVSTANLTMSNATYDLSGKGSIILEDKKVNFALTVNSKTPATSTVAEITTYLKQNPLPIGVTGTLDQLVFTPDLQNFTVSIIKQTQAALLKKAATKMADAAGPSQSNTKTADEIFIESLKGLKN